MSLNLRDTNVRKLRERVFDVCIVGGGINGAVSAAALAARGVSVALIDKGDFGGSTSSQSSNLAWGGIKYLESREFSLVWKLCKSRNHLMESYPSTVKEIRFLTTVQRGFRFPPFLVYLGTVLYWFIGRFRTRAPHYVTRRSVSRREAVIQTDQASAAIEYSDCYLHDNDARFVFNFVRSAMNYGAIAANYVNSKAAVRDADAWSIDSIDEMTGERFTIRSKILINACGPEVDHYNRFCGQRTEHRHAFSKGIHLIVDRVTESRRILAFFASDGRLFFVIPMGPKTCIGTTDTRVDNPDVAVSDEDRAFVLGNANEMLALDTPLTSDDIIAERCGVRPLAVRGHDETTDWVSLSRKHAIETDAGNRHLSIFGGKLTDCLNVGNEVSELVESLGVRVPYPDKKWYGEPDASVRAEFVHQARLLGLDEMTDPRACEPLTDRLWRRYGATAFEMLESIREDPANATCMIDNAEYLRCEIEQAGRREMITKLEDFLRRRSKISLVVRHDDFIHSAGLVEACRVLFGAEAEAKLSEYVESMNLGRNARENADPPATALQP